MATDKRVSFFSNLNPTTALYTIPNLRLPSGQPVTYPQSSNVIDPTKQDPHQVQGQPAPQIAPPNSQNIGQTGPGGGTMLLRSPFSAKAKCFNGRRFNTQVQDTAGNPIPHGGIDLLALDGAVKLYACCTGSVSFVSNAYDAKNRDPFVGYAIKIRNGTPINGKLYNFYYLHMACAPVINGKPAKGEDPVALGDYLGDMDDTGYSFGAHLHLIVEDINVGAVPVKFGNFGAFSYVDADPIFSGQGVPLL